MSGAKGGSLEIVSLSGCGSRLLFGGQDAKRTDGQRHILSLGVPFTTRHSSSRNDTARAVIPLDSTQPGGVRRQLEKCLPGLLGELPQARAESINRAGTSLCCREQRRAGRLFHPRSLRHRYGGGLVVSLSLHSPILLTLLSPLLSPSSSSPPYPPSSPPSHPPQQKCAGTQTTFILAPTPTTNVSSAFVLAITAPPVDPSSSSPIRTVTPYLTVLSAQTPPSIHGQSSGDVWTEYGSTSHQEGTALREACCS